MTSKTLSAALQRETEKILKTAIEELDELTKALEAQKQYIASLEARIAKFEADQNA